MRWHEVSGRHQLPPSLARWLRDQGHDANHVFDVGLAHLDDGDLWSRAAADVRIIVSKDEDFLYMANRAEAPGRLVWVRLGNCRNPPLLAAFAKALPMILAAFDDGQRVVELV